MSYAVLRVNGMVIRHRLQSMVSLESRPDCGVGQYATTAVRAVPGRNDNGFFTRQVSVAMCANQKRVIQIGPVAAVEAK